MLGGGSGGGSGGEAPPVADRRKVRAAIFDLSRHVVEVVGESFHQGDLERIGGGRDTFGVRAPDQLAGLLLEPTNPVDPEAVEVQIDGATVGHLSREDARAFRPILDRLAVHDLHMGCHARLTGGWDRGGADQGSIGVRLLVGSPAELWAEMDAMFGPAGPPPVVDSPFAPMGHPPRILDADAVHEWAGRSVCFTGPSRFAYRGSPVGRGRQELLAVRRGMVVLPRVVKGLDMLVVADPALRTGKMTTAARYGTTIVDEGTFWATLGVILDPLDE